MRLMGMCEVGGGCLSAGVAEELNGRTPTDPGARWIVLVKKFFFS
jgi:hypothetical protein